MYVVIAAKAKKTVEDKVKEYGGLVAAALNKQCTMLVLSEKDASAWLCLSKSSVLFSLFFGPPDGAWPKGGKYATQVAKARKLKVARVTPEYFDKCEEEEKLVDRSAYLIKTEEDEEEEEEEEEEVKPPKAKAADDSDTMQVDPKSKKRKADSLDDEEVHDAPTATSATSSTTTAPAATAKKAKTELATVRSTRTSVPRVTATILTHLLIFPPMCRARAVVMRPPRPTFTFKRRACGLAWPSKPTLTRALSCAFLPRMC